MEETTITSSSSQFDENKKMADLSEKKEENEVEVNCEVITTTTTTTKDNDDDELQDFQDRFLKKCSSVDQVVKKLLFLAFVGTFFVYEISFVRVLYYFGQITNDWVVTNIVQHSAIELFWNTLILFLAQTNPAFIDYIYSSDYVTHLANNISIVILTFLKYKLLLKSARRMVNNLGLANSLFSHLEHLGKEANYDDDNNNNDNNNKYTTKILTLLVLDCVCKYLTVVVVVQYMIYEAWVFVNDTYLTSLALASSSSLSSSSSVLFSTSVGKEGQSGMLLFYIARRMLKVRYVLKCVDLLQQIDLVQELSLIHI